MNFIEWLKVILLGIVEGITEWLPISSTGHLILTDAIWPLQQSDAFKEMFNVVIQLGAILAVVVLYWSKLWPFHRKRIPQRSWFAQQSTNGFVGGLLYAALKGWEPEKWIQFGWASGALATTFLTDYAQPADEDMVWSVWSGNARVKR